MLKRLRYSVIVLMPEVGILFLIQSFAGYDENFKKFCLNARGGHFVFNTRLSLVGNPLFWESLNARGGHFVFNTNILSDKLPNVIRVNVLMPEVGILFLIPASCRTYHSKGRMS